MIEMRWLTRPHPDHPGTQEVLQYRQTFDATVRAGGPGTWDRDTISLTADYQWSEWKDVPKVWGVKE